MLQVAHDLNVSSDAINAIVIIVIILGLRPALLQFHYLNYTVTSVQHGATCLLATVPLT